MGRVPSHPDHPATRSGLIAQVETGPLLTKSRNKDLARAARGRVPVPHGRSFDANEAAGLACPCVRARQEVDSGPTPPDALPGFRGVVGGVVGWAFRLRRIPLTCKISRRRRGSGTKAVRRRRKAEARSSKSSGQETPARQEEIGTNKKEWTAGCNESAADE